MESNDSPEIPDRGETSDIPGIPSGADSETDLCQEQNSNNHLEKNKQGEEILSAIGNIAYQLRKEIRFMA